MTDKKQPEALRIADAAANAGDAGYPTAKKANAYYLCLLDECAQMIRKLHAENTPLQAGYAAARLEIESLRARGVEPDVSGYVSEWSGGLCTSDEAMDGIAKLYGAQPAGAQQPGTAGLIGALEDAQRAINSMKVEAETAAQGDEQMMLEACEAISNEGLQADMAIRAALASHGQAPAQAAPAAVAGPSWEAIRTVQMQYAGIVKAAVGLLAAVDDRHDSDSPIKYTIPYGAVNALRDALTAAPTTQPAPQQEAQGPGVKHGDAHRTAQSWGLLDAQASAYNQWFNGERCAAYEGDMWSFGRAAWMACATQQAPAAQGDALSQAARDVLAERRRQVEVEGLDAEHDGEAHDGRDLAEAAACYLLCDSGVRPLDRGAVQGLPHGGHLWPWEPHWWKPKDEYQNLKRAAALVLARMDQLNGADAARAEGGA